ncbi:ankyrin repeat domain-containing protein EMB506, chloroplastic isoform X2 [Prosopis cineraria]|uniref:ankyrin repeat domain-containing protein EMB506, chloroplastic isoform X2 n=1 Tax=Prosopis cineraria TaxID=364024 RepID=UPI00240F8D92|nr:ankyrin repeat domain-containing protein EMB506, chloroplastic isoform X2 [Prosopis cineraria]
MSYWSLSSVLNNQPMPLSAASTKSSVHIESSACFISSLSQRRSNKELGKNLMMAVGVSMMMTKKMSKQKMRTMALKVIGKRKGLQHQPLMILKKEVEQLLEPEERAVLQQNVTPNLRKISTEKWSPLHTLALSTQIRCMDQLLESGVDIDLKNKEGLTALHTAIIGKKEAVISHLLRKGASPHVKDKDGATPLHYAVQVGAKQTVKLLIKYKVDVNVADHEGWTPLHVAIQSRNRDIAKILLVNGADKTRRNKDGKTALDLSLCYGKNFKSYDLGKLLKVVPADSDF